MDRRVKIVLVITLIRLILFPDFAYSLRNPLMFDDDEQSGRFEEELPVYAREDAMERAMKDVAEWGPLELPSTNTGLASYANTRFYYNLLDTGFTSEKGLTHRKWTDDMDISGYTGTKTLSMYFWQGLGLTAEYREFAEPLIVHELIEEDFTPPFEKAHDMATLYHLAYARTYMDEETYGRFVEWMKQFEKYRALFSRFPFLEQKTSRELRENI